MEDRELLELAAKAAGIYLEWDGPPDQWQSMFYEGETYHFWNPLIDDGDALRLAVELRLVVHVWDDGSGVSAAKTAPDGDDPSDDSGAWYWATSNGDTSAAARYAIVGAAAKIGSAMP